MNIFIGTGNICKDIELKYTASTNKEVVVNSIAIRNDFKNKDGKYDTTFINFVVYGTSAKFLSQYAKKGSKILLQGRLDVSKYEDKDGKTEYATKIIADKIELLNKKEENNTLNQVMDEDLPF